MKFKAALPLFITSAIWGFAFVAQRVGMEHLGPFTFNGIRFALGSLSLLPLILYFNHFPLNEKQPTQEPLKVSWVGLLAGLIIFLAASLQQIGIIYTTAGKAAFITCMYIVLVPVAGIFLKHRISLFTWSGCIVTTIGLYFLCVKESFTISYGDLLELIGALFWTLHILLIDHVSRRVDVLKLASLQFATCSILSLCVAFFLESFEWESIVKAAIPILYGGICSAGIAYTLQIVGQRNTSPALASIILSMETVFAAFGGYLILDEQLGLREIFGAGLMLTGMLLAQIQSQHTVK